MITRRDLFGACATTALASALAVRSADAQAWPTRIVRLVAPFPPGGGTDAVARIIGARLSELWGQQVIIENRAGAGSNIGAEAVARSEPDGYTFLLGSLPLAVNRYLYPSLGYDSLTDLAPITLLCRYPNLLVVPATSPAKSLAEFVAYAKANPGKVTFASPGIGTSGHLSGELFKRMAGIEMTHVPYRGTGAGAMSDLLAGRIDSMFNTTGSLLTTVRAGQIRALAVTTGERFPTAPEIPTIAESGVPGFDVSSWYGLFAPAKTPPEIIRKISETTVSALSEPAVKARLEPLGVLVVGSTPEQLGALLRAETDKWGPIIKEAGISLRE